MHLDADPATTTATLRARVAASTLALLAVVGVTVVVVAPTSLAGAVTYLVVAVAAAVVAGVGGTRRRRTPGARLAGYVGLGVVANGVGEVVWQVQAWTLGAAPDVSVADVFYVLSYVAVAAGLVTQTAGGALDRRAGLHALLDGGAVLTLALLVVWQASVQGTLADPALPALTKVVLALYPVLDAVLIGLVARWVLLQRRFGLVGLLLVGGAGCWLVSDLGWLLLAAPDSFGGWLTAGWLAGAVLLAGVTWCSHQGVAAGGSPTGSPGLTRARLAVALLPLLVPAVLTVVAASGGEAVDPWPGMLATLVLVLLFAVRADGLLRDTQCATERLASQARRFEALARGSSDAFAVVGSDGRLTGASPSLGGLVGGPDAASHERLQELLAGAGVDPVEVEGVLERARLQPGAVFELELAGRRPTGEQVWFGGRAIALLDDPDVRGVVVTLHDITRRKLVEGELEHQAFHDGLTGLANRTLFLDRTEQALRRAERGGGVPTVLCLDLDGFKTVNDGLGHLAGDELLREVARRLQEVVRAADTVARLGGDEFVVLMDQTSGGRDEAAALADRVLAALADPVDLDGTTVTVSASIGVVRASAESTPLALLRDGDIAMYRAKAAGRGRSVEFAPDMRLAELERLRLESDLAATTDGSQLRLVYQPVVDLADEQVVGFEALLRWDHPELGTVAPDRFVPVAEQTGMIVPIGRWVLDEATRAVARWQRLHPRSPAVSMAVNVSARQLASRSLVAHVREALRRSGIPPASLVLEVTETALVTDPAAVAVTMAELRALGVRLALDDFGTGYSSLSYLRQFDVDILKIDRSFVSTMTADGDDASMLQGLLELGRRLHLEVVAEGVELEVQRDLLRDERCGFAQGYLFARPLEHADAEQLLVARPALRRAVPSPRDGARDSRSLLTVEGD